MKRFTALFLTLAMLLSFCPTTVWAEEQQAYTDDQVYVVEEEADNISEEDIATTPEEKAETPSLEETEDTKNNETVYTSEAVAVSAPLANSVLASAEARWGLTNGTSEPLSWVNSGGTLADAMTYVNGLATGTAYIQLRSDVNITDTLVFDYGKTTILDLNGCDIDRGLSEDENDGSVIRSEGNLTLCDTSANVTTTPGKITGGNCSEGGGVFNVGDFVMNGGAIIGNTVRRYGGGVYSFGNFTMNGGTISGNVAESGGGLISNSEITMTGEMIIGNNATQFDGRSVYFIGSEMKISGTPIISGNVSNGTLNTTIGLYELGEESNYCGVPITVVGALNEGASISVTGWDTIATGSEDPAYTLTASDAAKFFCDNDGFIVVDNNCNELQVESGSVSLFGKSTAGIGCDVTLTLNIDGAGITGMSATMDYDSDALEFVEFNSLPAGWDAERDGATITLSGTTNYSNADALSMTFRVKDGISVGTTVNISFKNIVLFSGSSEMFASPASWSAQAILSARHVGGLQPARTTIKCLPLGFMVHWLRP